MITTYLLLLILCQPGAWTGCSNGLQVERIPGLPDEAACEKVAELLKKGRNYRSHTCIPQVAK